MWGKMLLGTGVTTVIGTGAVTGALIGGQTGGDAKQGALIGGTVGAASTMGVAGLAMGAPKFGKYVQENALGWGENALTFGKTKSTAIANALTSEKAKAFYLGTGKVAGGAVVGAGALSAGVALKAGAKYGNIATGIFSLNRDYGTTGNRGGIIKLNAAGHVALGVGSAVSAGVNVFNTFNNARVGQSSGEVLTATPDFARSSTMRNAGATGDLAFAAYSQRRG